MLCRVLLTTLLGLPSLALAVKIITRPHIQTVFNSSLAAFFSLHGVLGPVFFFFTVSVLQNFEKESEKLRENCARYVELRHLLYESLKIIMCNIWFRAFYILYADRGFVKSGLNNTRLFRALFVLGAAQ